MYYSIQIASECMHCLLDKEHYLLIDSPLKKNNTDFICNILHIWYFTSIQNPYQFHICRSIYLLIWNLVIPLGFEPSSNISV